MKLYLIVLAALLLLSFAQDKRPPIKDKAHRRTSEEEKIYRNTIKERNKKRVEEHNAQGHPFKLTHQKFGHLTTAEIKATYTGLLSKHPLRRVQRASVVKSKQNNQVTSNQKVQNEKLSEKEKLKKMKSQEKIQQFEKNSNIETTSEQTLHQELLTSTKGTSSSGTLLQAIPTNFFYVDWTGVNASWVTTPKDQGACGSCWSFSGLGEIQSYFLRRYNLYLDLAEQQMVDCVSTIQPQNAGCGGGYLDDCSFYASQLPVTTERYYPYFQKTGTCDQQRAAAGKYMVNSYVDVVGCSEVINALLHEQPVHLYNHVDYNFGMYKSGVLTNCDVLEEGQTEFGNHAVIAVGIKFDGTGNPQNNWWKIKNSWGTDWGEGGFIRLFYDPTDTEGTCEVCSGGNFSI